MDIDIAFLSNNFLADNGVTLVNEWGAKSVEKNNYRKTSNIRRTLVGNAIVYHSDVVGASPVGAAPTTASFSTEHLASMDWANTTARGTRNINVLEFDTSQITHLTVMMVYISDTICLQ